MLPITDKVDIIFSAARRCSTQAGIVTSPQSQRRPSVLDRQHDRVAGHDHGSQVGFNIGAI